jgi:AcrR family transcriptional regulator
MPAEARRRQLLLAAVEVFARSGYHGATTRAIAHQAGVAEALLYRYFDSKQALFQAAVVDTSTRLIAGLQAIMERHPDDPHAALSELMHFGRQALLRSERLAKMVFIVSAELDDPAVRDVYLPLQQQALHIVEDALARWQRQGLIHNALPPQAAAWLVLGAFQALALMKHSGALRTIQAQQAIDLLRSLLPPSPRASA